MDKTPSLADFLGEEPNGLDLGLLAAKQAASKLADDLQSASKPLASRASQLASQVASRASQVASLSKPGSKPESGLLTSKQARGGLARAARLSPERRREIARQARAAQLGKKPLGFNPDGMPD